MSNFAFLQSEWPEVYEAARRAERFARPDPRAACFYCRRALELCIEWMFTHDKALKLPYEASLSALIHEPTFRGVVGSTVWMKAKLLKDLGNRAVHEKGRIQDYEARNGVTELFHVTFWLARTYARGAKPADGLAFNPSLLQPATKAAAAPAPQSAAQLQALAKQLADKDAHIKAILEGKASLDAELVRLRDEIAKVKAENAARPDEHDYSEAETRDRFIDVLLREAGWPLSEARDREWPVDGMPTTTGKGFVDYVLWGDDGRPLALVEAKRTARDEREGKVQAKLYADCLEKQLGQRPILFYTNGERHWIWDDAWAPPRPVQGFYKKAELELLIQRRKTRASLAATKIDTTIADRFYQKRAIERIAEHFEKDRQRRALLVMATGSGKTRTVVALCDQLLRANWAKRILFLADRRQLVKQAVSAFKKHLPAVTVVNLLDDKEAEGRVYVSTYPTMMGLIDESLAGKASGQKRFGVGHFDLVVIDEAHRSVYQKYRHLFDYFDSLLVGLTATPRAEIDHNTYSLFELQTGVPTDYYELDAAVKDGYLVPPRSVSVKGKFLRRGLKYDELSDEEKDRWDALEWSEDGDVPDQVDAAAMNKWLFNEDTVDKVLAHVMSSGQKVEGGDRLGKTIVFARSHAHAEYIVERFDANWPHYKGEFAQVIDNQVDYADRLIDAFSQPEKAPHLAVSVDMLDTGIDVPEVVNLVFFKPVRSKTKFWQMLGRGTRLRPDLFGPERDKQFFFLFDYCGNLEYFAADPPETPGALSPALGTQLFTRRLDLLAALDARMVRPKALGPNVLAQGGAEGPYGSPDDIALRDETAALLTRHVAAMNVDNFIVRPERKRVERWAQSAAWKTLGPNDLAELARHVAPLPTELASDDEEAKRFDLLMLRLQLALLRAEPTFARLRDQVREIAAALEQKSSIPMVAAELPLIAELQSDDYWQDVTAPLLEVARKRLRALVKLVDKAKRKIVYTDFADELGTGELVALPGVGTGTDYERFQAKARRFLREHEDHVALRKVRMNRPLTHTDLDELSRMLREAGGSEGDIERARAESEGLGLFIRSLVGLDRAAAKEAFGELLDGQHATANQIAFIDMLIDHLTEHGVMDARLLYESPFTDVSPRGPEGIFSAAQVVRVCAVLDDLKQSALA